MKLLPVTLLFYFSSSLVLTAEIPDIQLDKIALEECNATNPVQRHAVNVIDYALLAGDKINLSHEEKCFVFCFLQKVHFLNENANIKNGAGLVRHILKKDPELVNYTDGITSGTWLANRMHNGIEDKCEKAFVIYNQYETTLLTFAVAHILEQNTHVKEIVFKTMSSGQQFNETLPQEITTYLTKINRLITRTGKSLLATANAKVGNKTES